MKKSSNEKFKELLKHYEKELKDLENKEITTLKGQLIKSEAEFSRATGYSDILEKQLSYFKDPRTAWKSSSACPACEWEDGKITKLCWTHEAYQAVEKRISNLYKRFGKALKTVAEGEIVVTSLGEKLHQIDKQLIEAKSARTVAYGKWQEAEKREVTLKKKLADVTLQRAEAIQAEEK